MLAKRVSIILTLLLCALSAAQAQTQQKASYESLLERVKKSDQTVDFKELRMAYTETKDYSPYGEDREDRNAMFAALKAKEFAKAQKLADQKLQKKFVDINAQFVSYAANKELKNEKEAAFHQYVLLGLLKSIKGDVDGLSVEQAFTVIATDEEYMLLEFMGYSVVSQALLNEKGHAYDKMSVVDKETNKAAVFYFNIDKPFNWLSNTFKKE